MKKAAVYLLVVLSLLSSGLLLVPGIHAQTSNVKVVSFSQYFDSNGYLVVVGEVQNVGSSTIGAIYLTGSATVPDNSEPASSNTIVYVADLLPQQKAPFYMDFYGVNGDVNNIEITVAVADPTPSYLYPDLTVTQQSASVVDGVYWVNGAIQNTGTQTATNIRVIGTFYNSEGSVVAIGYSDVLNSTANPQNPTYLPPAGSFNFKVGAFDVDQTVIPQDKKITSYSLLLQPEGPVLTGTGPTVTPYPVGGGTAPINNSGDSNNMNLIYAAIIAVTAIVVVGAILLVRKRTSHVAVDESRVQPTKKTRKERK